MTKSSKISGFYKLTQEERLKKVCEFSDLSPDEKNLLKKTGSLTHKKADKMLENTIGTFELPLSIAVNFLINEKDYLIPMVTEESSVVAAASNGAKIARKKGGFKTESTDPIMIGQIQVMNLDDISKAKKKIMEKKEELINIANEQDPMLVEAGGGARNLEMRKIDTESGEMLIVHLMVNTRDAMGANAVNSMVESIGPVIEDITGGTVLLRILTNLAKKRIAKAKAVFSKKALGGESTVEKIIRAYHFAKADPYRCATHNKGIMNGIDAVALATGNDFRALEAGSHAFAAENKNYSPLTHWKKTKKGDLLGEIKVPLAVGTIGGATQVNPISKICLKILNTKTSSELAEVMAAVGLAQNLAALRALSEEGIQKGHMKLHAKNIAYLAGAQDNLIDKVSKKMIKEEKISMDRAKKILENLEENN